MRRFRSPAWILLVATSLTSACGGDHAQAPAPAKAAAPAAISEPEACRSCHADVVARFEASAHRLAARSLPATPPPAARFEPGAPMEESARAAMTLRASDGTVVVADAAGAMEARPVTHVLGGRRREDFLSPVGSEPHVLPASWSVTRATWVSPLAEELGAPIEPGSPLDWTKPRRAHATSCSRCHALPAADEGSGMTCSTCHGDASAHVAQASGAADAATWTRNAMRREGRDAWKGCATCHAVAVERPKSEGLGPDAPFADRFLPATLAGPSGLDRRFRLDATPALAHGMEVQSLGTSPCFLAGGATCTTCHDPHGGPGAALRDPDPDASCRSCHAAVAPEHARHPMAASPVPSSRAEPGGPTKGRLPGCVDCHAPALLPFGKGDAARDHAIGVPDPVLDSANGILDACTGCHAGRPPAALAKSLPPKGGEERARVRRMKAFRAATDPGGDAARAAKLPTAVVADGRQDAGSRASAAHLLSGLGPAAAPAAPALAQAWSTATDPWLVIAASNADARVGGDLAPLRARLDQERDWRIALAIAGGLAARGLPRGMEAMEVIHADESLPSIARADAGTDLGVLLLQQRSCSRAEAVLTDVVARNPDSLAGWLNLGVAHACLGQAADAREAFLHVLEMQPDHEMALRNLAMLESTAMPPQ